MLPKKGSLRNNVIRAFSWTIVGQVCSLLLRFLGSLILTRIFAPEIFGILAIVSVVQIVTHLFTDVGIVQAVIQSKNGEDRLFLNTAWTLQVLRGVVIWLLGIIVAVALAFAVRADWISSDSVYAHPGLPQILIVACFASVLTGLQTTKSIVASRRLDIKRVTLIDIISQIAFLAFVIVVGELTHSIWAYVAAGLLNSFVTVVLSHLWLPGPINRFSWHAKSLKELSAFGRWVFASSALGGIAANGDRLFLAAVITPAGLGFYSLANNLLSIVDSLVTRLFAAIALPALSEVARTERDHFPRFYFRVRWLTDAGMIGIAGFIFATGQRAVEILYDPRYWQAGWILQWLSFSLLFSRYVLAQNAYLALGLPHYGSVLNVVRLISLVVLLPLMYAIFGEPGAILAISIHMLPFALVSLYLNKKKGLNNYRLEFLVLGFWPVGWLLGIAALRGLAVVKTLFTTMT
jgi:O-antigen/teichoic acid export membrane protein